jgi:hypothetical protein
VEVEVQVVRADMMVQLQQELEGMVVQEAAELLALQQEEQEEHALAYAEHPMVQMVLMELMVLPAQMEHLDLQGQLLVDFSIRVLKEEMALMAVAEVVEKVAVAEQDKDLRLDVLMEQAQAVVVAEVAAKEEQVEQEDMEADLRLVYFCLTMEITGI